VLKNSRFKSNAPFLPLPLPPPSHNGNHNYNNNNIRATSLPSHSPAPNSSQKKASHLFRRRRRRSFFLSSLPSPRRRRADFIASTVDLESPPLPSTAASSDSDLQLWLSDPFLSSRQHKSSLHRCRTAPAISPIDGGHNSDSQSSSPSDHGPKDPSLVRNACLLLFGYLAFGVVVYAVCPSSFSGQSTHPVVDAFYFCIVTMCTIGYGDITPATPLAKLFSITFVIVGFGFVDILLTIMVGYVLDLQESLLTAAARDRAAGRPGAGGRGGGGGGGGDVNYLIDVKKGRVRIRTKVALALGVVVLCVGVGAAVLRFVERLGWLDAFYLAVMSVTTVGYGDRAFRTLPGRLFASVWLLVSTLAVARAFLYLAEARIDKRHRMIAKWVLCRDMTVSEFLAADIDHNGFGPMRTLVFELLPFGLCCAAVLIGGAIIAIAVIIYLAVGVIGFSRPSALYVKTPTNPTVDALYFSVSTLATVGYGDAHPGTSLFKVLSVPFTLLGYALLNLLVAVTVPAAAKLLAVLRRRYRVLIAAAAILLPVAAGALVFHLVETQGWVDSVYMSVISVTTVGYGDEVFKTRPGRAFASVWLLIGTLSVTHSFNFLVDKLLDWWTPRTNFVTSLHRLRQTIGKKRNRRKNYNVLVEIRLAAFGQMKNLGDE
ncbi:Two pore potassium channel c, partial [Ananas comosus]